MTGLTAVAQARLLQRRTAIQQSLESGPPPTRSALEQELAETDAALERIEHGSFGRCETCGKAIGRQRLLALPAARLCIECTASARGKSPL
jgi:RNA polymerase-binding transcription factor DksA